MATYSKVILSGQPLSYPTLVTATSTTLASGIYVTAVASPTTTTATVNTAVAAALSNTITYTTSASHSFVVGQLISIAGFTAGTNFASANLSNLIITSVPSATTFTASIPFTVGAISATASATATSYNAVYTTTSTVQFATTQLVTVTGLTTAGYNVSSSPITAVGGSSGSYTFTTPVLSTTTGAITSQTGTATASPTVGTFIHNNTGAGLDEVWLYANNLSNAAIQLTLQYGISQTGASPFIAGQQIITIPAQSGLTLITPGLILSNNTSSTLYSAIYAYASTANVIALSGYVNRII
jgi:hypothetical protein